ncbi:piRNA biogenesis protein EXD1 isoform X2 [Eleutherodactylus coqui]|uniref:piRNA biogenesis protein EXD1 isoform X2 n=1 Tax=Eleutherodactylus coqui TaxID=57060 RepID=UPI003462B5D3
MWWSSAMTGFREFSYSCNMDLTKEAHVLSRFIGTNIKLTTAHGCFQGELFHIDAARAIILSKVKDLRTGNPLPGMMLFFGNSILKVETKEEHSDLISRGEDEPLDESVNMLSQDSFQPAPKPDDVDATAHPRMEKSDVQIFNYSGDDENINYIVIDKFQPMFGPAVRHLQNQKVLSLAAVTLNESPYGKLCWLQVATKFRVYIFDILLLGPRVFKNGLQMVLEDKGILKVVHDCRWLGNFLSQRYSVVLANVFDTQVADVYLFSLETGGFLPSRARTVKECLTQYLKLSPSHGSFLMYKQTLMKDNPNIWCDRPLPTAALKLLSLEVMYLLSLRLSMLDAMLADYTLLVDGYLNACCQRTSDVFLSSETTSSELPKELQQLCVLQQRRREKALKEYQVNSLGFLIRAEI